ncbi:MAG: ferrous iron transport protein A [Burkholderiales bacterium]|nr:ferrous iron transport protein A [Burkholderiales bacterium]
MSAPSVNIANAAGHVPAACVRTPSGVGLDTWPLHTDAWVTGFAATASDDEAHTLLRLLEIGFLPGERVRLMACSLPGRDPLAVRVGHSTFALRRHEAALVHVTGVAGMSDVRDAWGVTA